MPDHHQDQPIIVGAGIAGLMVALHLAPEPVTILTRSRLGVDTASAWAQGGVAAALGSDDHPSLHAQDTQACGDGLCDLGAVNHIAASAQSAIDALIHHGVLFDHSTEYAFEFGLEGGHSRRRILHVADSTGRSIMNALVAAIRRTPSVTVIEGAAARDLIRSDGRIVGVLVMIDGRHVALRSSRVVIATGGIGGLFDRTTNPLGAIGSGLALAVRAGAALADMEFVQFHPTALDVGLDPMPLISEAMRGEGAVLVDGKGTPIMAGHPRGDLEPRDVVTRVLSQHLAGGRRIFLDARAALGSGFASPFPAISEICLAAGIDPRREPIPVRPAAHYAMGGIAVDHNGRSTVEGLWACGEASSTGLHGANRLASNSLLEAVVTARDVAVSVAEAPVGKPSLGPSRAIAALPAAPTAPSFLRRLMSAKVGIRRDRISLRDAMETLAPIAFGSTSDADTALVGLMIATAAWRREESRGAHWRTDCTGKSSRWARRLTLTLDEVREVLDEAIDDPVASCGRA